MIDSCDDDLERNGNGDLVYHIMDMEIKSRAH